MDHQKFDDFTHLFFIFDKLHLILVNERAEVVIDKFFL